MKNLTIRWLNNEQGSFLLECYSNHRFFEVDVIAHHHECSLIHSLKSKQTTDGVKMENMRFVRPLLCRLCECPVAEGGVRVSQVDRDKLSEWWLLHLDTQLDDEDLENVWICQFCEWDARFVISNFYCTHAASLASIFSPSLSLFHFVLF